MGDDRERSVLDALRAQAPDIPWDVKNQAAVHLWYPQVFGVEVEPLVSSADGVATWPETATTVAVRLLADDTIEVVATHGLRDLFGMICRRNPRRVTIQEYHRRIQGKPIATRWAGVLVLRKRHPPGHRLRAELVESNRWPNERERHTRRHRSSADP